MSSTTIGASAGGRRTGRDLAGRTAIELAELVRSGTVGAGDVVEAHLRRIDELEPAFNAFQVVLRDEARGAARALDQLRDRSALPLAGVPVAIKDNVDVAGQPTRNGTLATPPVPAREDDLAVARLREAGAVIVGKTAVPAFCVWPWTESHGFGATHNPWDRERTPGGSSGGSAAAVAAGMVPLALGSDGLGSIRIPAGACGVAGIRPGRGVAPRPRSAGSAWFGMSEWGPIGTTVADIALTLDVIGAREDLRDPPAPDGPLRVAVSERSPMLGVRVQRLVKRTTRLVAASLRAGGHAVRPADPPYPASLVLPVLQRWLAGPAEDAEGLPRALMERRSRRHLAAGQVVRRLWPPREADAERFRSAMEDWFRAHDVLITPALATLPPRIGATPSTAWIRSLIASTRFAPFPSPWNLAGFPAAVVPGGLTRSGHPVGVQLVAPRGREGTILQLAAEIERLRPWPRLASV